MASSFSRRLSKPIPTVWLLGGLLFIVVLLQGSFLEDGDSGVHVRAGQLMLQTHEFIRTDPFSYFTPAVHWNNHEWLSQIVMAVFYGVGEFKAVIFFYALLLIVTHMLLFKQMEAKSNKMTALLLFPLIFY